MNHKLDFVCITNYSMSDFNKGTGGASGTRGTSNSYAKLNGKRNLDFVIQYLLTMLAKIKLQSVELDKD